nr:hypothetical protein [Novosphingobium aquimarinum]
MPAEQRTIRFDNSLSDIILPPVGSIRLAFLGVAVATTPIAQIREFERHDEITIAINRAPANRFPSLDWRQIRLGGSIYNSMRFHHALHMLIARRNTPTAISL